MRIVEILIAINALCGIAAFLIARGLWRKASSKFRSLVDGEDNDRRDPRILGPGKEQ